MNICMLVKLFLGEDYFICNYSSSSGSFFYLCTVSVPVLLPFFFFKYLKKI